MSEPPNAQNPPRSLAPKPSAVTSHRDSLAIMDELAEARARYYKLEPAVRDYYIRRQWALTYRAKLEDDWNRKTPEIPFNPNAYTPPATVPPADHQEQRDFHRVHYVINRLERELEAAKQAEAGGLT